MFDYFLCVTKYAEQEDILFLHLFIHFGREAKATKSEKIVIHY